MRCEIPHRCVRRKYRIRRHSPFRLRNCWEGRSVRASSLLRQLAKGGCAARRLSWVTPGFSQSRRCKTTASEFLKERTDGLKAFKNVFKGFVDKVKDKTAQFQEKHDLEPKKNEFELTHNREVKKERSRDQGMSL